MAALYNSCHCGCRLTGWSCSECDWNFPLPSLLNPESFIARAKGLVMRGFKPKDAAEITAKEIMFENHDDPDIARKVQIEVNDFLRRVKEGLI